jgi:hypothetical protein
MTQKQHFEKNRTRKHLIQTPAVKSGGIEEMIRLRAYEIYEARGAEPGDPESDWYRAEAEIVPRATEKAH